MSPLIKQSWVVSAVLINMFGQGMILSFSTAVLPALLREDSPIKTDLDTASWYGSLVGPAAFPGFLLSSICMDLFGRRVTHGFCILPAVICWLLTYFATDMATLMIARFLGGLSSAATVSLGAIIIGEYSCPKHRGVFLYLKNAAVCMGAALVHTLSHFLYWRTIAMVALIPLIIALAINYTWPESPAWLASKEQYEKCEKAFIWLRGLDEESSRELELMIKAQMKWMSQPKIKKTVWENIIIFFKKFTRKDFLKPFMIMLLAALVLEVSGRHVFPSYAVQIVSTLTQDKSLIFYYTLSIDIIITASALFSSCLVKIMSRRSLLFITGFASFVVLVIFCSYLYLESIGVIPNGPSWIPLTLFSIYFVLANLGCAPIPLALVGEVFPLIHRGSGAATSGVWISLCLMLALKATPHMLAGIHIYGTFAVYGGILFISLLILYFIMPETKDRTLQEIENYFNHGSYDNELFKDDEAVERMVELKVKKINGSLEAALD